jgi:hypothetical protein
MIKRFDSSLENRRVYKMDAQYHTETPSEGNLRSLKGVGVAPRGSGDYSGYNDTFKKT